MIIYWLHPPFLGCWNMFFNPISPHCTRLSGFTKHNDDSADSVGATCGMVCWLIHIVCVYIYIYVYIIIYPHVKYSHVLSVYLSIYLSIDRSECNDLTIMGSVSAGEAHQKWASQHPRGSFLWRLGCNRHPPGGSMDSRNAEFAENILAVSRKILEDSGSLVSLESKLQ